MIEIRKAKQNEIEWINDRYDEVGFMHSSFENEVIAIAEFEGQRAGLGRLVEIDSINLEMGGMYVFEAFRNKGIARKIVEFLLRFTPQQQTIYCIPFEHLLPFYSQFGFIPCVTMGQVPCEISKKLSWCRNSYLSQTTLLVLKMKLMLK